MRDYYLGRPNTDYDFATDATPNDVMRLFHAVIPTGIKHGTVTVLYGKASYEVTTFRIDGSYSDARHPDTIQYAKTLEEDLKRRDFTINALAVDAATAKLIDVHGGLEDLKRKQIRAIGDPYHRFTEDALRIMRACRLACQLDFTLEERTAIAMKELAPRLAYVSQERIREELWKILEAEQPSKGFLLLSETGALPVVLPELEACKGIVQNGYHTHDLFYHSIFSCDGAPRKNIIVRLAALLHDIGKAETCRLAEDGTYTFYQHEQVSEKRARAILERLKCSHDERDRVTNLIKHHMFHYTSDWSDGAVRRFINAVGKEALEDLFALRLADQIGTYGSTCPQMVREFSLRIDEVLARSAALTIKDLAVHGNDLARIGIPKGPIMGEILRELLATVLDDPSQNTSERLLFIAKRLYEQRVVNTHSPTSAS